MTELEKAARQALEALVWANEYLVTMGENLFPKSKAQPGSTTWHVEKAITALRRALEKPAQQEPAAIDRSDAVNLARNLLEVRNFKGITSYGVRVLCEAVMKIDAALYTRPQAQQKPLTDDEIARALASAGLIPEDYREDGQIEPLVRAIERSHGIKGAP